MELLEPIETINRRLIDYFGIFETNEANWRVAFSDDLTEVRLEKFVNGIELPVAMMVEQPKYNYIHGKYILERLFPVPLIHMDELTTKTTYEPVWVFEDHFKNPLPPKWEYIQWIIMKIHEQAAQAVGVKYKMPFEEQQTKEAIEARVSMLEKELFGNETKIGDALKFDSGVGYGPRKRNDS